MTKARTIGLAALLSLAVLIPAGSAKAVTGGQVPYCASLRATGQWDPLTLAPGKVCSFVPVAVRFYSAAWDIVKPGTGSVCTGVIQSPPGWPDGKPLDPVTGQPIAWGIPNKSPCVDIARYRNTVWEAQNGFGAVYGQPVVVNFSTATIRTDNTCCLLFYYY
jgi:hypothetical protein